MTRVDSSVQVLVCPHCHGMLAPGAGRLACGACDLEYPVDGAVVDFTHGRYYDEFHGPEHLTPDHLAGLRNEVTGTTARIEDYYLPLIRSDPTSGGVSQGRALRVLDSGCGNGLSVDLLNQAGLEAWGNDLSALRKWQWRERSASHRLVAADTRKLPFPNAYFDFVLSSGVLEHVGVVEHVDSRYTVEPQPDRDAVRVDFLRELLRVTAPHGKLLLDFPNGTFPFDFWHGRTPGGARFHSIREGFLPTVREVEAYVRQIGPYEVKPMSPYRRLRMRQVSRHWYGQVLRWPMTAFLKCMELPLLRSLAGSPLNPYLVLKIQMGERRSRLGGWC